MSFERCKKCEHFFENNYDNCFDCNRFYEEDMYKHEDLGDGKTCKGCEYETIGIRKYPCSVCPRCMHDHFKELDLKKIKPKCNQCEHFVPCGCGCGWGYCFADNEVFSDFGIFNGEDKADECFEENGSYADMLEHFSIEAGEAKLDICRDEL